jgi:hypothetical protein
MSLSFSECFLALWNNKLFQSRAGQTLCQWPDNKYFQLCEPYGFCCNYLNLPSHRKAAIDCKLMSRSCSSKSLLRKTGVWQGLNCGPHCANFSSGLLSVLFYSSLQIGHFSKEPWFLLVVNGH